ncbi:MAG: cyclic nucleotide-binding domain-containing protein [Anaerolineales bacterium]|nr:cyclic nucleotide-binding domain-containing protein [Anaerolineales bacterium]
MATVDTFKHVKDTQNFSAGSIIFNEGDQGDLMYVVQEGELEVYYRNKVIETIGPGGLVGEMALVDQSPRSATVIAKTDCKLVCLDETGFKIHVSHTPFFAVQVMRIMVERLRRMLQYVV